MKIEDSVALVTGANRGIGLELVKALLARGAKKVYAAARDPKSVTLAGVIPLRLDVTSSEQVIAAAKQANDVSLVINNAGIATTTPLLGAAGPTALRKELETNVFGLLAVSNAFAPVLAKQGGGALVNILSVASWATMPLLATYAASKSAAWSVTNGIRNELRAQHTQVLGAHFGFVDTDLTAGIDMPKLAPAHVAAAILDGLAAGQEEVVVDDYTRAVKAGFANGIYLGNSRER
jgi:NAD(P)-dependent dehydrogenase (short-subunit alcohol dehydrogenase family)